MALRTSSKDRIDMDGLKRTMEQAIEPASQVEQKSDRDIVSDLSDVVYLGFTSFLLNHDDYLKLKLSKVENEPQKSIDKTTKKLNDKMADFWKADVSLDAYIRSKEDTKVESWMKSSRC